MRPVSAVISRGRIKVILSSAPYRINCVLHLLFTTMNRYLPPTLQQQHQFNMLNGAFLPRQGFFPNPGMNVPAHLQMQAQMSQLSKVQLTLLQQQFLHNYTFTNSEKYHPSSQDNQPGYSRMHHTIRQELLRRLSAADSGIGSSVTSSRESSPDLTATLAHIMEARGTK